jgi:hypothetical protein
MMGFSLLLAKSFLVPGISDSAEVPLGALGQDLVPETAPRQLRFRDVSSPKIYRGDLVFSLMISFLSGHKPYIYKVYICSSLAKPLNTINFFNVVCTLLFCFGIQKQIKKKHSHSPPLSKYTHFGNVLPAFLGAP